MSKKHFCALLLAVACTNSGLGGAAYTYNLGAMTSGDTPLALDSTSNGGADSFSAVLREAAGRVILEKL